MRAIRVKRTVSVLLTSLMCLVLVDVEAGKPVVAFAQDTMANDFRKAQVMEVRDAMSRHKEYNFVYSDAKGKTALLINQIEKFIHQKVDVLIVGTNDERAVVPVIDKAMSAGIPVIILDRGIKGDNYTTFINSDNYEIGKMGASYLASKLGGKGRVLLFEGLPNADVTKLRSQGFLDEIAKHKGISVIRRTGNYLRRDAVSEMEKLVRKGIRVDAIFSESDSMLSGVRLVLRRYKIDPGSILMVGVDYTSEAQQAIRSGTQTGSILFPLAGTSSAEIAVSILKGKKVPKKISLPVKMITRQNVNQAKPIF